MFRVVHASNGTAATAGGRVAIPLFAKLTQSAEADTVLDDDEGIAFRDAVLYDRVNIQ